MMENFNEKKQPSDSRRKFVKNVGWGVAGGVFATTVLGSLKYFEDKEKISEITKERAEEIVLSAKKWMVDYVSSVEYSELLKKEVIAENKLNIKKEEKENLEEKVKKIVKERLERINNVPIVMRNNLIDLGVYTPKTDVIETKFIDQLSLNIDEVRKEYERLLKFKNMKEGTLYLSLNQPERFFLLTVIHELTHCSTDSISKMLDSTIKEMDSLYLKEGGQQQIHIPTGVSSGYNNRPSEIHARLTVFRYLLSENNCYNYSRDGEFKKIYLKKQCVKNIINDPVVQELLFSLKKKEDIVTLLNNYAYLTDDLVIDKT